MKEVILKGEDFMSTPTKKRPAAKKGTWGGRRPGAGAKKKPRPDDPMPASGVDPVPEPGPTIGHSDITDMARKFAETALRGAARVANSTKAKPSDVLKAADLILTWGYGKPMGIVAPPKQQAPAEAKEPELGKKAQLEHDARNPDPNSNMGRLLAKRAGLKVVNGDE